MNRKTLLYVFFVALVMGLAHLFAIATNLYWTTDWADIITHSLGGMMVGGVGIIVFGFKKKYIYKIWHVVLFGFLVGVGWEIFELLGGLTNINDKGYYINTCKDLFFDSLGAYITTLLLK